MAHFLNRDSSKEIIVLSNHLCRDKNIDCLLLPRNLESAKLLPFILLTSLKSLCLTMSLPKTCLPKLQSHLKVIFCTLGF